MNAKQCKFKGKDAFALKIIHWKLKNRSQIYWSFSSFFINAIFVKNKIACISSFYVPAKSSVKIYIVRLLINETGTTLNAFKHD